MYIREQPSRRIVVCRMSTEFKTLEHFPPEQLVESILKKKEERTAMILREGRQTPADGVAIGQKA
jgi:hypothetical protein